MTDTKIGSAKIIEETSHARVSKTSKYITYHEVCETEPRYFYAISFPRLNDHLRQLDHLRNCGVEDLDSRCITFDDGHISQFQRAFPLLEEYSFKATFFITVGWTARRAGYMSWNHLAELVKAGHNIQAHGWSHTHLTQCTDQQLEGELGRSKLELEDRLGISVTEMSTPGGRWNASVLRACASAGYQRVFTSDPWRNTRHKSGIHTQGRWMVSRRMDANTISLIVGGHSSFTRLRVEHAVKAAARSVLGDRRYQELWRLLAQKRSSDENLMQQHDEDTTG